MKAMPRVATTVTLRIAEPRPTLFARFIPVALSESSPVTGPSPR
jgi:hypothetical protein